MHLSAFEDYFANNTCPKSLGAGGLEAGPGAGAAAIRQVHVPGDHGVNGPQVPTAFQWLWRDPHLVVVAVLQHHHGDGAGAAAPRRLRVRLRPYSLR